MQDIIKKHWGKIISLIVGAIATVSVAYTTLQVNTGKIEKLEEWRGIHEVKTAEFMGSVLARLESIDHTLKRLEQHE